MIARYNKYMEETPRKLTPPTEREYYLRELGSMLGEKPTETPLDVLNAQTEPPSPLLEQDVLPPVKDGVDLDLDAQERGILIGADRNQKRVTGPESRPSRQRVHMFSYALKKPGESKEVVSKEPRFKTVEEAVLSVADSNDKTGIISLVLGMRDRGDIAHNNTISRATIGKAISDLIDSKVLVVGKDGALNVVRVGGDSTHESNNTQDKHTDAKPSIIDKMNMFVDTVTEKALEGTAYGRLVEKLESLVQNAPDKVKTKLRKLFQKVTDGEGVENIINNLATIDGWVPDSEYANLVTIAEQAVEEKKQHESVVPMSGSTSTTPMFPAQKPKAVPTPRPIVPAEVSHKVITVEELNRKAEEARNAGIEKLALEKTDEEKAHLIEGAQNFDELYEALRLCKAIRGSDGTIFTAEELISKIEGVRELLNIDKSSVNFLNRYITRTYDLRDKVKELWTIEHTHKTTEQHSVESLPVYTGDMQATSDLYDEPIGPVRKEDLSKEESEKIEREMRAQLDVARENFATHEAEYKTKVREGKKMFRSIMEKLGAPEKQRPALAREAEHIEAEKAYMEAKWNLKNFISGRNIKEAPFSRANSLLGLDHAENKKIDVGVLEQAEKEYHLLQDRIMEITPEKEKSTIEKCFQKWNSLPLAQRVVLSSALLTAGGLALGTVGVSGALATLGWRATRAFVGTNIGLAAGKVYGNAKEKEIKEKREEYLDRYGSKKVLEKDQFIEEEKNLEQFFQQEKDEVMKNQIKKGLVTAAVAGVSTVGLGMGGQALMGESAPSGAKVSGNVDTTPKPKVVEAPTAQPAKMSWFERMVKGVPEKETPPSHPVEVASPEKINLKVYEPVGVKLSSSGFIDTVSKLKTSLQGHSMSPSVEKLLAQSPEKIAMDLGLYKPGQVAESAFGFQGEELTMNADGDITIMHNDGSVNILFDASGKAHQFGEYAGNTMFDADKPTASPTPKDVASVKAPVVPETPVPKSIPPTPEMGISATRPLISTTADSAVAGSSVFEAPIPKTINFEQIIAPGTTYTGPEDMVSGKLPLKPEYQFDPKFKAERTAYNMRLEKELMNIPQDMFDLRYPIEYNGGRINVFQKGEHILILLNGQKIGTGQIIDGKLGLQYESSLGKGMLGIRSDFEQAFEKARVEIEKNNMFFKVKK